MDKLTKQVAGILEACLREMDNEPELTAAMLADKALAKIDPRHKSPPLVVETCHSQLREMAEALLTRLYANPHRSAAELLAHANALEAETESLVRDGLLPHDNKTN